MADTCKLISYDSPFLDDMNIVESEIGKTNAMIEAASTAIERATNRKFLKAQYDETYNANQFGSALLNQFPLITVDRVYSNTGLAIKIINDSSSVSNASYNTTSTALNLSRTASGVITTNELTYASNATLTALISAIDAIANGWDATIQGSYGAYASTDIVQDQYGNAKASNGIRLWLESNSRWFVDNREQALITSEFVRGDYVRVVYTAGFAEKNIPEDIKEITAVLVKDMLSGGGSQIASESLGGYSYSLAQGAVQRLPLSAREKLASYKDRVV